MTMTAPAGYPVEFGPQLVDMLCVLVDERQHRAVVGRPSRCGLTDPECRFPDVAPLIMTVPSESTVIVL